MKAEVVKAYGPWPKGHVFEDMPPNVYRTLVGRGLVREIKAPSLIDRILDRSPEDRMMRGRVKKTG